MSAKVETMMSVREIPWHKQGTILDDIATAEEAIKAAGLDWEVELAPAYMMVGNKKIEYVDHDRLYRSGYSGDLYGAWFGSGSDIKERAWKYLNQN